MAKVGRGRKVSECVEEKLLLSGLLDVDTPGPTIRALVEEVFPAMDPVLRGDLIDWARNRGTDLRAARVRELDATVERARAFGTAAVERARRYRAVAVSTWTALGQRPDLAAEVARYVPSAGGGPGASPAATPAQEPAEAVAPAVDPTTASPVEFWTHQVRGLARSLELAQLRGAASIPGIARQLAKARAELERARGDAAAQVTDPVEAERVIREAGWTRGEVA